MDVQEYVIYASVGNATSVGVEIASSQYARLEDFTFHVNDANAHSNFKGCTETANGVRGFVPQPQAGDGEKFLSAKGGWEKAKMTTLELVNILYPKGIILPFADGTDPNEIWQGTTWKRTLQGRVAIGAGDYWENGKNSPTKSGTRAAKRNTNSLRGNWRKSRLGLRPLRCLYLGLHRFTASSQTIHPPTNIRTCHGTGGLEPLSAVKKREVAPRTTEWRFETSLKPYPRLSLLPLLVGTKNTKTGRRSKAYVIGSAPNSKHLDMASYSRALPPSRSWKLLQKGTAIYSQCGLSTADPFHPRILRR